MTDFALKTFTLKPQYSRVAQLCLSKIAEQYYKDNPTRINSLHPLTFVGVHHRRGDHLQLQQELGVGVGVKYFLSSMEMFREKYHNPLFIFVSDDMLWAQQNLLPKIKSKDFFLAGALLVTLYY